VTHCIQCGYSLEGLGDDANCPECATPVQRSRYGFLFVYAGDEYTRTVIRGLRFVAIGVLVFIVMLVAVIVAPIAVAGPTTSAVRQLLNLVLFLPLAMILAGYLGFVTPDPGLTRGDQPIRARRWARVGVLACAVAIALTPLVSLVAPGGVGARSLTTALLVLRGVLVVAGAGMTFVGGGVYLAWLARRIPDKKLVRRAKRLLWLVPLLVLAPFLCIIVATGFGVGAGGMAGPTVFFMWLGCGALVLWVVALVLWWNLLDAVRKGIVKARASAVAPRPPGLPA
jgi:hypothetical protein